LVCRGVYHLKWGEAEVDIQSILAQRLAAVGLSIDRYRIKRFSERGVELSQPYATRRALLVGEAAGIDALTGEGIAQAIEYGAFAGPYLAEKLAVRDFGMSDFTARLRRSKVGVGLRVRTHVLPFFFGKRRRVLERYLVGTPSFLALGIQHFAGRPLSP